MTVRGYLLSLPERAARAVLGLGASTAREVGEVALPEAFAAASCTRTWWTRLSGF
jgi:hypothetical protein